MKRFLVSAAVGFGFAFLASGVVSASGGGGHSHDHHAVQKSADETTITYKDSNDGVEAFLEFCAVNDSTRESKNGFFVKCHAKAYLRDAKTGEPITPSKLVLRATTGHDQFGEAMVFAPASDAKMQTELFVKHKGEHHYLLIAEIEGTGVKEFHFHHTF